MRAEALAVRVAGGRVAGEVVQRAAVVGDLHRAIRASERGERAGHAVPATGDPPAATVSGGQRRGAGIDARAGVRVSGCEGVERLAVGPVRNEPTASLPVATATATLRAAGDAAGAFDGVLERRCRRAGPTPAETTSARPRRRQSRRSAASWRSTASVGRCRSGPPMPGPRSRRARRWRRRCRRATTIGRPISAAAGGEGGDRGLGRMGSRSLRSAAGSLPERRSGPDPVRGTRPDRRALSSVSPAQHGHLGRGVAQLGSAYRSGR